MTNEHTPRGAAEDSASNTSALSDWGWDALFEEAFQRFAREGMEAARVAREDRGRYLLRLAEGEADGRVSGRFAHEAVQRSDFPAVGDWVAVRRADARGEGVIQAVLPRKSCFARQPPGGRAEEQVVAANVDTVFIVSGLDGGRAFNPRRLERYLALAHESGAAPVLVLNKADLCADAEALVREAEAVAAGAPVLAVSALSGIGVDVLRARLPAGATGALLGSSGVGKSALVNALVGAARQETGAVRAADLRGRHTTTRRELLRVPGGGVVIDTPGMRELQVRGDEESIDAAFAEIDELAAQCRFRDCRHEGEPGCAVQRALEEGLLDPERYESYLRLQREAAHLARRFDQRARSEERAKWKKISQAAREVSRRKR